jgi:hypothetical protein
MTVWNVKSDFEEFVDENADAGKDDYDFEESVWPRNEVWTEQG